MPCEDLWGKTECVVNTHSPLIDPPKHQRAVLFCRYLGNKCVQCQCADDQSSWDHCIVTVSSLSRTNMLHRSLVCEGAYEVFTHSDAVKQSGRTCISKQVGDTWWLMATFPLISTPGFHLIHNWIHIWSSWQQEESLSHPDVTYIKDKPWTTLGVNDFQNATQIPQHSSASITSKWLSRAKDINWTYQSWSWDGFLACRNVSYFCLVLTHF